MDGQFELKENGSFLMAVIYCGVGEMLCCNESYAFSQGDELFFSAAIEKLTWKTSKPS